MYRLQQACPSSARSMGCPMKGLKTHLQVSWALSPASPLVDPPHLWIAVTNTNTDTVLLGARHTAGALHENIWHLAKIVSHVGSWCFSFRFSLLPQLKADIIGVQPESGLATGTAGHRFAVHLPTWPSPTFWTSTHLDVSRTGL